MQITKICLTRDYVGLKPFTLHGLGDVVVLAGKNGSGKTRLLKLIHKTVSNIKNPSANTDENYSPLTMNIRINGEEVLFDQSNASQINVINYSHFDAQVQNPDKYPPYVIHQAKENLKRCDINETALNAFLYVKDLAKEYSPEFKKGGEFKRFQDELSKFFNLELTRDKNTSEPYLFSRSLGEAALSPGQLYLLRMAVALHCNEVQSQLVLLLDEPETHLHPEALIQLISGLRAKFADVQIWVSTHSLPLISYFSTELDDHNSIYHMKDGEIHRLGSNSTELIDGLIGNESNRIALQQFIASPDVFACNHFAIECMYKPKPPQDGSRADPQAETSYDLLVDGNLVILDYGAGQGRFLHELIKFDNNFSSIITYYAYDIDATYSAQCKKVMRNNMVEDANYYNDYDELFIKINSKADYVFLVNVLHEVPPKDWPTLFKNVSKVLNKNGKLVIVERNELTIGEQAYDNGFVVLTETSIKILIPSLNKKSICIKNEKFIRFSIPKSELSIDENNVDMCLNELHRESLNEINNIKHNNTEKGSRFNPFKYGIKLAFWTHQYANTALLLENKTDS